jgi:NTE family protein
LRSIINAKLKIAAPNLLIRPAVGQFRVLDFRRMNGILEASREAKEAALSGLVAALERAEARQSAI